MILHFNYDLNEEYDTRRYNRERRTYNEINPRMRNVLISRNILNAMIENDFHPPENTNFIVVDDN